MGIVAVWDREPKFTQRDGLGFQLSYRISYWVTQEIEWSLGCCFPLTEPCPSSPGELGQETWTTAGCRVTSSLSITPRFQAGNPVCLAPGGLNTCGGTFGFPLKAKRQYPASRKHQGEHVFKENKRIVRIVVIGKAPSFSCFGVFLVITCSANSIFT